MLEVAREALNPKMTKPILVSRSRTHAPGYGDLTLGCAELKEVKSLRIIGVALDSELTFETHLLEVVSKATISLGVVSRAVKLFNCLNVLKSGFNAYVLTSLKYFVHV